MFDNDEEKAKLVHFGVLGMKWGRRKAEGSEGSGSSSGGSKGSGGIRIGKKKGQSDADFDKEYEAEIAAGKEHDAKVNTAKTNFKAAQAHAKAHPDDADAQIAEYRAGKALDAAKGKNPIRIGKKKGQSDADFDAEFDAEVENSLRAVAAENKKRMDKKAAKTSAQLAKDETQAALIRQKAAKDRAAFLENYAAQSVGGLGRNKYDPKRAERAADRIFGEDMNKSAADIKADRIANGVSLALGFVVAAGITGYNMYKISKGK